MLIKQCIAGVALLASSWAATRAGAQDVLITEFMTANDSTLADQDGDYSDWIEVFNAGASTANLDGWFLSDDPFDLNKWRFPAVNLAPRGFLVVFASGKDRRNPGSQLHTNFKLASEEAFLGLVAADGFTLTSAYAPYPQQVGDFSYGLSQNASVVPLIGSNVPAKALIPANGNLGLTWTQAVFNEAGWLSGNTGVGYDRNPDYIPLIGIDVRTQMDNVNATCYIRIPFTVSDPSRIGGFFLRMKYDDGFIVYINGMRVESRNDPAGPTWNSGASALHDDTVAVIFEEYTLSAPPGLLQAGSNVLAIHGLNSGAGSSDFLIAPELDGVDPGQLDRDTKLYFPRATPGYGNLQGYPGIAATPQISPQSVVFTGTQAVTLSVTSAQTAIRYTTNGSEPAESSTLYTSPISIQASTMVRAKGFESGLAPSPTVSHGYIGLAADVVNFNTNLPVVLIDNFGAGAVPQDPKQTAFLALFEHGTDGRTRLNSAPTLETRIAIKVRGSTSAGEPKKSYTFEAWDEKNVDKDILPLGMPEESDWVLYGAHTYDRALMRNVFIYELSNQVGRYATTSRFCEVYVNEGGGTLSQVDYRGVYSFMEKIKRDPDRVDVEKLTASQVVEPEVSGGYMLKIDRLDPGDSGFGAGGQGLGYVYPKEEIIEQVPAQANYIRDYIDTMVTTLNGANFADPVNGYARYIDVLSWIDHHILNVLPKNVDALRLSTYMFKKRGGKYEYGPIWDFDRSMNSIDGRDDNPTTWNGLPDGTDYFNYPWWQRLFQDPEFWQRWRDRWHELRLAQLSALRMNGIIDTFAAEITEAQARDSAQWNQISPAGWRTEITNLKNWLATRASWIDSQFTTPPAFNRNGGPISPGFMLTMSAPAGTIYYTLDGSDPRLRGGGNAPGAVAYSGGITLNANARAVARAKRSASDWSAPTAATFVVSTPSLVITEMMYHPSDPLPSSLYDADDFEFIELQNIGGQPLNLAGFRLTTGIDFTFPGGSGSTLQPGDYVVVVKNLTAFETRYETAGMLIAGEYSGNLSNNGEAIVLEGPLREPILNFSYHDFWYPSTDGLGDSLVIVDPAASLGSWNLMQSWAASSVLGGTPGEDDGTDLGGRQLIGDSNQDAAVDISDAISFLLRLYPGAPVTPPCDGATIADGGNLILFDLNDDNLVNGTDAVYLLNYLFQNGPAPVLGTSCQRIQGCPNVCR